MPFPFFLYTMVSFRPMLIYRYSITRLSHKVEPIYSYFRINPYFFYIFVQKINTKARPFQRSGLFHRQITHPSTCFQLGISPFRVTVAEILLYKKPFAVLTTCSDAGAEDTVNGTVND